MNDYEIANCQCGHSFLLHCKEDEDGLYFDVCDGLNCGCKEYLQDESNMNLYSISEFGVIE